MQQVEQKKKMASLKNTVKFHEKHQISSHQKQ